MVVREQPYDPKTVRLAAAAAIVMLVGAGLIVFPAKRAVDQSSNSCDISGFVGFGSFIALAAGFVIVLTASIRAIRGGSWSSIVVAVSGLSAFLLGVAGFYLVGLGEGCSD